MSTDRNALEHTVRTCYSTWGERYYADYYEREGAYPPVHIGLMRGLLADRKAHTVLDAGCGPASMLRHLDLPELDRYGFDLTPEMIAEARRIMAEQGVPGDHLWIGSVLDAGAFSPPSAVLGGFDAALCFGVMPHIPAPSDAVVIRNLAEAVRPGGIVAIEARNELFSLFTQNRYSHDFFRHRLIDEIHLRSKASSPAETAALDAALAQIATWFHMDLPPIRKGYGNEPGYDQILSRTHNPFEMAALARTEGLIDVETLFYHFHALPPLLEPTAPQIFRLASLDMEKPRDWRGYFMASAFILVGRRPE